MSSVNIHHGDALEILADKIERVEKWLASLQAKQRRRTR